MERKLLKSKESKIRQLTKKEKLLLIILGLVLFLWLSNKFVLTPQAEKMSALEAKKRDLDSKIVDINNKLKMEEKMKKEWEILHKRRNDILSNYFPVLDQSQIIYLLNDLMVDDRVKITDFNFDRPSVEEIGEMDVKEMSVSIPFRGNYDGIVNIAKSIETSPRRILLDSLSMDILANDELSGNMSLKVYSLEGLLPDDDQNTIYVVNDNDSGEGSPFTSFNDYKKDNEEDDIEESVADISSEIDSDGQQNSYILNDFESVNYSFIPSNELINGDVISSTIRKSGKYSLRFEYNILALEEENRAYIDMSSSNIEFKYPPESINIWVNAYGYSPGTLGMRFRTQDGEDIDVIASEGISWLGWSNIETKPPLDLSLYPLKLTHLYYELPYNRDDYGVLLIDKLEAIYPISEDNNANDAPINDFYIVQSGDTVASISKKIYGTIAYKNEIIKNNSLNSYDILPVGKVLVLIRR